MIDLSAIDLEVDKVYGGSRKGNASDDPLPSLLGVDSGAGFRHLGQRPATETLKMLVLKTSFLNQNWPDHLDTETGVFTYFGDNKSPGDLHSTPRKGNLILRNLFDAAHDRSITDHFPPIFLFGGLGRGTFRDLKFLGLAVPGAEGVGPDDDLIAIWRSTGRQNERFQNYRAKLTVLDVSVVKRAWIEDIQKGAAARSQWAPQPWLNWLKTRKYQPLRAPHTIEIRSKSEQLPQNKEESEVIKLIQSRYSNPFEFEAFAVEIAILMMPNIASCDLTKPWRDGGRDAVGNYVISTGKSKIEVEFALEAKCYALNNGVGVKELSRLISRLRHRQFGILVTSSYLANQAYKEVKKDGHPVVIISATDIANTLLSRIGSIAVIEAWLDGI